MGVEVGSGVKVAVGVFSTGCDVDVDSACSMGADVDAAGLAQADRNMINVNTRATILFMVPLFVGKTKRGGVSPPLHLICHCDEPQTARVLSPTKQSLAYEEIASSPYGLLATTC